MEHFAARNDSPHQHIKSQTQLYNPQACLGTTLPAYRYGGLQEQQAQQQQTVQVKLQKDECNFCEHPFAPGELRMCCHECKDFSLCLDCYKAGAEYKVHRVTHRMYQRCEYDNVAWPDGFTVQDDLLLLEALELHGIGSWDAVRAFMKRPQTEPIEVIIKHWALVYAKGGLLYDAPKAVVLPDVRLYETFVPLRDFEAANPPRESTTAAEVFSLYYAQYKMPALTIFAALQADVMNFQAWNNNFMQKLYKQPILILSDPVTQRLPPFTQLNEVPSSTGEGTGQQYVLGSWPFREEFSYELNNKAEYPLMYMHFMSGRESKASMEAKIRVLQCYANRVVYRHRRKKFLFYYSLHRQDRRVDEVSVHADAEVLRYLGRAREISELQGMPADEQVIKFEIENPYLLRAFSTRLDFRRFAFNVLQERATRECIFRLQIARMLGFRYISRMTEVVNFLKNPGALGYEKSRFPPGVVLFEQNEAQKFTLNNQAYFGEFRADLKHPENAGSVSINTSMNGKLSIDYLNQTVDSALTAQMQAKNFPQYIFHFPLQEKILALMRSNFALPANDVRSYVYQDCCKIARSLGLASFADLQLCNTDMLLSIIYSIKIQFFKSDCDICGNCLRQNHSCGSRCFVRYFHHSVQRIQERRRAFYNANVHEGLLKCAQCLPHAHTYFCPYLTLDVARIRCNLTERAGMCPEKATALRFADGYVSTELVPDAQLPESRLTELSAQLQNDDTAYDGSVTYSTYYSPVLKQANTQSAHSHVQLSNSLYDAYEPFKTEFLLLAEFFDAAPIPEFQPFENEMDVVSTLLETHTVPFFNPRAQFAYLNRALDLLLHASYFTESAQQYAAFFYRTSTIAVGLIAQLVQALYFLCSMVSLTSNLLSIALYTRKPQVQFNQTTLSDVQILFILLQSFQGLTYLPKSRDFGAIATFLTEFPKAMLGSFYLDASIYNTEQVLTSALGSYASLLTSTAQRVFDDYNLVSDFQQLFAQDGVDFRLAVEALCRRIGAGGAALRQTLNMQQTVSCQSANYTPSNQRLLQSQSQVQGQSQGQQYTFHAVFAAAALYHVLIQTFTSASSGIFRTLLLQAIVSFGLRNPLIYPSLLNELYRRRFVLLEQRELTPAVQTGIKQKLMDLNKITCQSVQYAKPLCSLAVGRLNVLESIPRLPRLVQFMQSAALLYMRFLPPTHYIFSKKTQNASKLQQKYPAESLQMALLSSEFLFKMTREEYMQNRIRLFYEQKSCIFHYLSEQRLKSVLLVLSSVVTAVELQLNTISSKQSAVIRLMNEAFPSDQINANAAAIDRNLGDFVFATRAAEMRFCQVVPVKKNYTFIINVLKQQNLNPEEFVCVYPVDFLFGPKVYHNGADDPFSVIPLNQNIRKLKQSKIPHNRSQKPSDSFYQAEYVQKYLTRGELALCCLTKIYVANYLQAKISFVSNGYIITNHILGALDWRPGIAEIMAYLCLAQFNYNDNSTVPALSDTDNCFSAYDWSFCTPDRVFSFNEVLSQQELQQSLTQQRFSVREVATKIQFKFYQSMVLNIQSLKVINSKIYPRVQYLLPTPASLLVKATETQSIEMADKLCEKLNQILIKSRIFYDFGEAVRGISAPRIIIKRSPEAIVYTNRSYFAENKESFMQDIYELKSQRKQRAALQYPLYPPPYSQFGNTYVIKASPTLTQIQSFKTYGTHDEMLNRCFGGFSAVPQFPVYEFDSLCPYLFQHIRENMLRK